MHVCRASTLRREEIQEERLERKMEILKDAIHKSHKRLRVAEDDGEEYVSSHLVHAEEVKVEVCNRSCSRPQFRGLFHEAS